MESFPDCYGVLGVRPAASPTEIRQAYRRRALEIHPDVNPSSDATERFKELNRAYHILSDPVRRSIYDSFRTHIKSSPLANVSPVPTVILTRQEKSRLILSGIGTVLRTPLFWMIASGFMLIAGTVVFFLQPIGDVTFDWLIAVFIGGGSVMHLNAITNRAESRRLAKQLDFLKSIDNVTANLWAGTVGCSVSIMISLLTIMAIGGVIVPHLTNALMLVFATMLVASGLWFTTERFVRSRAISIQLYEPNE